MLEAREESYRAVVGLGANVGDRDEQLRCALDRLGRVPGVTLLGCSRIFETSPVGGVAQADFLNGAALVSTTLPPLELLDRLLEIERALGRVRPDRVRFGPRAIDLDLLWLEGPAVLEPTLVIPHPRLTERAFALVPLCELVPDAKDPNTGVRYAELPASREPLEERRG
ncbi:MAG: 2-amino-4-hydroxy-6-hydroxymethyldihydropteridine diphosphokinase [Myxococcales bacterium]|nr:2-amino-4-hydroxy-6-hydroxymethyldihydropteridine diphosphokinase [Myxococcales bacterium]